MSSQSATIVQCLWNYCNVLRDESLEDSASLPAPDVLAAEFTACVLMEVYDLGDRSGNAWRYIQAYASNPIQAIARALDTVEKVLEVLGV
jgi:hypothetical protein